MSNQHFVLSWPCADCGAELNEVLFDKNRKFCNTCREQRRKKNIETQRFRRYGFKVTKYNKILYALRTYKKITLGELVAYSQSKKNSVYMMLTALRKEGHQIKFSYGFYYYGGQK